MFREETPRVVEASPQILCFKIKALFSVGIWVAPRLLRTFHTQIHSPGKPTTRQAEKRPGQRGGIEQAPGAGLAPALAPGRPGGRRWERRGGREKRRHVLYKTCFHHILPGCPGLQAPMALPCLNDVLGGCNIAPPAPTDICQPPLGEA